MVMMGYRHSIKRCKQNIGRDVEILTLAGKRGRIVGVCNSSDFKVYVFGNGGLWVFNRKELKFVESKP